VGRSSGLKTSLLHTICLEPSPVPGAGATMASGRPESCQKSHYYNSMREHRAHVHTANTLPAMRAAARSRASGLARGEGSAITSRAPAAYGLTLLSNGMTWLCGHFMALSQCKGKGHGPRRLKCLQAIASFMQKPVADHGNEHVVYSLSRVFRALSRSFVLFGYCILQTSQ
jgi:hypothetical protein